MLSVGVVVAAALLWLGVLFAAALYGERHPQAFAGRWRHVYALSLAVHCTSWTFYGTITQAARHGWPVPPTFLGAILFYALAFAFMVRLVRLARESNATSLADLIATRLGKDAWLAATVTLVAALGLVPYIALQLKAVTMSFGMLTGAAVADVADVPAWGDSALYVALELFWRGHSHISMALAGGTCLVLLLLEAAFGICVGCMLQRALTSTPPQHCADGSCASAH